MLLLLALLSVDGTTNVTSYWGKESMMCWASRKVSCGDGGGGGGEGGGSERSRAKAADREPFDNDNHL